MDEVDEIVCVGSDDEYYQSPSERLRRYEARARDFLSGRTPFILSASLRGPFEVCGWVNPWRSRHSRDASREETAQSTCAKQQGSCASARSAAQYLHDTQPAPQKSHLPSRETPEFPGPEGSQLLDDETAERVRQWVGDVSESFAAGQAAVPSGQLERPRRGRKPVDEADQTEGNITPLSSTRQNRKRPYSGSSNVEESPTIAAAGRRMRPRIEKRGQNATAVQLAPTTSETATAEKRRDAARRGRSTVAPMSSPLRESPQRVNVPGSGITETGRLSASQPAMPVARDDSSVSSDDLLVPKIIVQRRTNPQRRAARKDAKAAVTSAECHDRPAGLIASMDGRPNSGPTTEISTENMRPDTEMKHDEPANVAGEAELPDAPLGSESPERASVTYADSGYVNGDSVMGNTDYDQIPTQPKTPVRRIAGGRAARAARMLLATPTKTPSGSNDRTIQASVEHTEDSQDRDKGRTGSNSRIISTFHGTHLPSPVQTSAHSSEASPCPSRFASAFADGTISTSQRVNDLQTLDIPAEDSNLSGLRTAEADSAGHQKMAPMQRTKRAGVRGILRTTGGARLRNKTRNHVTWDVPFSTTELEEQEKEAAIGRGVTRASSPPPAATPVADLPGAGERFGSHFAAVAARTDTLRLASGRGIRLVGAATAASGGPVGDKQSRAVAEELGISETRRLSVDLEGTGSIVADDAQAAEDEAAETVPANVAGLDETRAVIVGSDIECDSQGCPKDDADMVLDNLEEFLGMWDVDEELDKAAKSGANGIGRDERRVPELGAW